MAFKNFSILLIDFVNQILLAVFSTWNLFQKNKNLINKIFISISHESKSTLIMAT